MSNSNSSSSSSSVKISVSDAYDGGNGTFVEQRVSPDDPNLLEVLVKIKPDVYTELEDLQHMQYFSFRVTVNGIGSTPQRVRYILMNASDASYPEAWSGTTVCYTDNVQDVDSWKRNVDTFYTQGQLWWEHLHTTTSSNGGGSSDVVYFSYFAPYSYERHLGLISQCCGASQHHRQRANNVQTLGQTLEGREIDCVTTGTGELQCWIIHRQHPGETMAEHYAEGLLTRLLGLNNSNNKVDDDDDDDDAVVQQVKQIYTFHIVPCMCPDGAVRGHLRTNSVGANLNREWASKHNKGDDEYYYYQAPTLERSPEVYHVLARMQETGVDCFLDVHGDEELPFNFISGAKYVPNWGPRLEALHGAFTAAYSRANPDMQQRIGYPTPESPEFVLKYMNVATIQVAHRFDCLAMTLEMPFKDCMTNPDRAFGWTPARSRQLGASVLEPLLYVHKYLRADGDFWTQLPPEDAFVETTDDYEEHLPGEPFKPLHKRIYSDVHEGHPHGHMAPN